MALSFSQKNEYSSHLQSKVAELWLSGRWERIPRDALLGHDQLWNLATQTQLRSHVVTGAASLSHTVRFRSEMRVQLVGTDSGHSDTPEASAPYSSDVCIRICGRRVALTRADAEARESLALPKSIT